MYKPKTIKRKIATLKALFNYFEFEDVIVVNPFRKMKIADNIGIMYLFLSNEITMFFQVY